MSQMSRKAGTLLFGLYTSHSQVKRSSGTFTRACVQEQRRQHTAGCTVRYTPEAGGAGVLEPLPDPSSASASVFSA